MEEKNHLLIEFKNFQEIVFPENSFFLIDEYFKEASILEQIEPKNILCLEAQDLSKNISSLEKIYQFLIQNNANRKSTLVSIGGGSIGDIAGFAAATFMRGLDWWNVPTTLVAQADSAHGGKTAMNFNEIKNIIGTFYFPKKVIVDTDFLESLSQKKLNEGWVEIFKIFLAQQSHSFQDYFLKAPNEKLHSALKEAIQLKNRITSEDPFERTGLRTTLNLGHTLGHVLEALDGSISHGHAVYWGLHFSTLLSLRLNRIDSTSYETIVNALTNISFEKINFPNFNRIQEKLKSDKKGHSQWILLNSIGSSSREFVPEEEIEEAYGLFKEKYS